MSNLNQGTIIIEREFFPASIKHTKMPLAMYSHENMLINFKPNITR